LTVAIADATRLDDRPGAHLSTLQFDHRIFLFVGHLDRVVHGVTAEEILDACDEKMDASAGERLSNPTISIAQAVRRHNLATFRHMANQQIKRAQDALEPKMMRTMHPSLVQRVQSAAPLMVQGLRTNSRDPDAHVVYFDTEALIGNGNIYLLLPILYLPVQLNYSGFISLA
jgi:hypothetical protein